MRALFHGGQSPKLPQRIDMIPVKCATCSLVYYPVSSQFMLVPIAQVRQSLDRGGREPVRRSL